MDNSKDIFANQLAVHGIYELRSSIIKKINFILCNFTMPQYDLND